MLESPMIIFKPLILLIGLFIITFNPAFAGEKVNEIGKIIYSKKISSFSFLFLKDNKVVSYVLAAGNKKDNNKLQKLVNKSVRIIGDLNWKINNTETFSAKEVLTIIELNEFELNVLTYDSRKIIEQDNLISHVKFKTKYAPTPGMMVIEIPDAAANSTIGLASVVIGILAGPMVLIPAAVLGIEQLVVP